MGYKPTKWVDDVTHLNAENMNNIEDGIAALYPQEQVIAPEQTVTLTSETSFDVGGPITLADGVDIDSMAEDFNVIVDGTLLAFQDNHYQGQLDGGAYAGVQFNPIGETGNYSLGLLVVDSITDPSSPQVVPGDYTVEIKRSIPTTMTLPDASGLDDGSYKLEVSNGKWIVQRDLT